jgi:hypothetical protein
VTNVFSEIEASDDRLPYFQNNFTRTMPFIFVSFFAINLAYEGADTAGFMLSDVFEFSNELSPPLVDYPILHDLLLRNHENLVELVYFLIKMVEAVYFTIGASGFYLALINQLSVVGLY